MSRIIIIIIALLNACMISGQSPDQFFLKGMAALQQKHPEDAVLMLTNAIERNNADERYYLGRAEALYELGKFEQAGKDYDEANSIAPESGDLGLARVFTATGDDEKAFYYLKRHLQSDYRLSAAAITKDPAFTPLHEKDAWYDLWQQDWYNEFEKASAEVDYYLRKKDPEGALEYLNNNIGSFQKEAKYYALRARLYALQDNYAAAVADFSMALSLDKTDPDFCFGRGAAFLKSSKYKNAVEDISKGLRTDPARFEFYLERARAYAGLSDYPAAVNDVKFYLEYFPGDQQAVSLCGEMCFQNEDYINALKYFNQNLKADQNNPEYYKVRGKTYFKTKTFTYAINDLSMSLDLKPDDGETWLYLGLAKYETGEKEEACSCLQKAQKYGDMEALRYIVEYCGGVKVNQ